MGFSPSKFAVDGLKPIPQSRWQDWLKQGEFTDDPLDTFGGAGVVMIPRLQELLHFICDQGFEHHVAANLSAVSAYPLTASGNRGQAFSYQIAASNSPTTDRIPARLRFRIGTWNWGRLGQFGLPG